MSEGVAKKVLFIECDTPVTFEYVIEWVEGHEDMNISPMSGEIKAMGRTPIEIYYRPSSNTTANATFKMTTTEFNCKPCIVRVVGALKPEDVKRKDISYYFDENQGYNDEEMNTMRSKTLLGNKPSKYSKRPGSGVKLKKIDQTHLSSSRKAAMSTKRLAESTKRIKETQKTTQKGSMAATDAFATIKKKLTPEEQDFIMNYRKLEELDKVKEIKFFQCLGDPPITSEEIDNFNQGRKDFIDQTNFLRFQNTRYSTETDTDRVLVETDLPMELNAQLDLYQNNHFELRK